MATYKVNYYIKRNGREVTASHIAEAKNAKEAIEKTKEYIDAYHLPHLFRPKAEKLSDLDRQQFAGKTTRSPGIKENEIKEVLFGSLHDATAECRFLESIGVSESSNAYFAALIKAKTIHDLVEDMGLLVEYVTSSYFLQES